MNSLLERSADSERAWQLACTWFSLTERAQCHLVGVLDRPTRLFVLGNGPLTALCEGVRRALAARLAAETDDADERYATSLLRVTCADCHGQPEPPVEVEVDVEPLTVEGAPSPFLLVLGHVVTAPARAASPAVTAIRALLNRPEDRVLLLDLDRRTSTVIPPSGAIEPSRTSPIERLLGAIHPDERTDFERFVLEQLDQPGFSPARTTRARIRGHWRSCEIVIITWPRAGRTALCWVRPSTNLVQEACAGRGWCARDRTAHLERALKDVLSGVSNALGVAVPESGVPPELARIEQQLSAREREILRLVLRGLRPPSIAAELYLSPGTVRNHLSKIYRKFDVTSHAGLLEKLRITGS